MNTLLNADFKVESIPLIRAAYEATLTAAWIQQVDDALPAYLNRNHNQQKALRGTVQKAGWASGQTVIAADTLTPFLVSKESKAGASWTEQMCADFFAGDSMYSVYRGLSWLTHPTAVVTDLYVTLDNDDKPTLRNTANIDGEFITAWLHILCSTIIWSARALNLIDAQRARTGDRQRLRDWATKLRTTEFLAVTPEAKHAWVKQVPASMRELRGVTDLDDYIDRIVSHVAPVDPNPRQKSWTVGPLDLPYAIGYLDANGGRNLASDCS